MAKLIRALISRSISFSSTQKSRHFKDYYAIYIKGLHKDAFTHEARWELIEENIAYLALFA